MSVRARTSRKLAIALTVPTLLLVGTVLAMFFLDIPLGERGRMEYRYSPMALLRLTRSAPFWFGLMAAVASLYAIANPRTRMTGLVVWLVSIGLLCGWTWYVPPKPSSQHLFNMMSPSHDGAFVLESDMVRVPWAEYVRDYPLYLQRKPEEVLGTRVLSNPPGTTVLARAVTATVAAGDPYPWPERDLMDADLDEETARHLAARLRFSLVLTAALGLSAFFAYLSGRQFLSPVGAALVATIITINPATAVFSPGKDPAQLLTINAMLFAFFASATRPRLASVYAFLAGALLVVGSLFGLIHLWVALAATLAATWKVFADRHARIPMASPPRGGGVPPPYPLSTFLTRTVLPAAAGAITICAFAYIAFGWNVPAILLAVARRFKEIQYTIHFTRPFWAIIGFPLFLLFISPAVPALAVMKRHWRLRRVSWGTAILLSTLAVMLLTYCIGVTYELPRLWIAFLPLLTLGAAIDWPLLRGRSSRRALPAVVTVLLIHLFATLLYPSLLDARESEYRMIEKRMFE